MGLLTLAGLFPALAVSYGWRYLGEWDQPATEQIRRVIAAYPEAAKGHLARPNFSSSSGGYYFKGVELYGRYGGNAAFRYLWEESERSRKIPKGLALHGLAATGRAEALTKFRALLNDRFLQSTAIDALGWNGSPESISTLMALLSGDSSIVPSEIGLDLVAERAAYALAKAGPKALPILHAATRHPVSDVRQRAVLTIDLIGHGSSAETLWSVVRRGPKEPAQHQATIALAKLGDIRAVKPLMEIIEREGISEDTAKGLAACGKDPGAWLALRHWATEGSAACRAYARAGGKDLRVHWEKGLRGEKRHFFAEGLGELRDPRSVPALIDALQSPESSDAVRFALAAMGKPACVPVRQLLASKNEKVRVRAANTLALLGDGGALPILSRFPPEESWLVEEAVRGIILTSVDRSIRTARSR